MLQKNALALSPPPRATGVSLPFRPPPLPPTPSPVAAVGSGRRAKPGRRRRRRPSIPRAERAGRGPPLSWRRCFSGGCGPARPGDGDAVALRGGAAWRSARAVVAAGSSLATFWATWASDGLERASYGLGRARATELAVVLPGGEDDDCAWLLGTVPRPACRSRTTGALRARLGPAGPVGLVCFGCLVRSTTAARWWRWVPPAGCGAVVPYPGVVVYPHYTGRALLFSMRL
jgi:hypothetical protein